MSTTPHRLFLRRRALGAGLAVLGLLCAGGAAPRTAAAATSRAAHEHATAAQKHKQGAPKQHKRGAAQKHKATKGAVKEGIPHSAAPSAGPAPRNIADAPAEGPRVELSLPIQRVTLDNGLRVVLSADPSWPTVAVAVTYDAGPRHEFTGKSGVASVLERMMAQGSKNLASGDPLRLVTERGGALDSELSADATSYSEVVPESELALALWIEADRMKAPDLSAESFEAERRAAQEHRTSLLSAAYGRSSVRLAELVFQGYWPYEHATLGSAEDLRGAELGWVRDFHAAHFGPGNAVLSIAGDFDADEGLELVRKYFGSIPKPAVTPFADAPLPEQTSQRTAVVEDASARTPGILYGWAVPPLGHPDHYALELASVLLGRGESSRLYQLLVRDKAAAQSLRVATENRRGPDLFSIEVRLNPSASVGDVEKLIEGELKSLSTAGPSPAALTKAQRLVQTGLIANLESATARAKALGEQELVFGDATHLRGELSRYLAVTREDVQRVVRDQLGPARRTIVETYSPATAAAAPRAPEKIRPVDEAPPSTSTKRAAAKLGSSRSTSGASRSAAPRPAKKKTPGKPKKK